jgi:hypothetical protein
MAVLVATIPAVVEWSEVFGGDQALLAALLDRLV